MEIPSNNQIREVVIEANLVKEGNEDLLTQIIEAVKSLNSPIQNNNFDGTQRRNLALLIRKAATQTNPDNQKFFINTIRDQFLGQDVFTS